MPEQDLSLKTISNYPEKLAEREMEDIDALVTAHGESAYPYGSSSGAALVLEAAYKLPGKITKLAL
jgi:pimeloyl-ACP methyl ester carboxylesterase